jgi:hypothetical protein
MPLNAQHCHTDLMKIAQFVLSFSIPTPVGNNRNQDWPVQAEIRGDSVSYVHMFKTLMLSPLV